MKKPKNVLLMIELSSVTGRGLIKGITDYADMYGPWIFSGCTGDYHGKNLELLDWEVDGMIARDRSSRKIRALPIPKIMIAGGSDVDNSYPYIHTNAQQVTHMAIEHLLERGYKDLAFCGYAGVQWSMDRRTVFEAYQQEGDYCYYCFDHPRRYTGLSKPLEIDEMAKWLVSLPKPIGLVACNDERAYQVLEASKLADIKVPEEVAIIGIDNDEYLCNMAHPTLSSVGLDARKAGFEAAKLLDQLMAGETVSDNLIIMEPTEIYARQSTDIVAVGDSDLAEALRYIREYCKQPIGVEDVALACGLSRRVLEKRFKLYLHRTVHAELRRCRVNEIAKMLLETNMTMSQIARIMNMKNPRDVLRNFRLEKGITPLQYRAKHSY